MKTSSLFFGLLFLLLGVVFLGINFGVVTNEVWATLWKFWPVLLVAAGLGLLISNRRLLTLLYVVLALAVLIGAAILPILEKNGNVTSRVEWPLLFSQAAINRNESLAVPAGAKLQINLDGRTDLEILARDVNDVSIDLTGPERLLDEVHFSEKDGVILLSQERRRHWLKFADDIISGTITVPTSLPLELELGGISRMKLSGHAGLVTAKTSGVANLRVSGATTLDPKLDLSGAAAIHLDNCTGNASFRLSGTAKVSTKTCNLNSLAIDASGSSEVVIAEGAINELTIHASGVSRIRTPQPTGKLTQDASGTTKIELFESKVN